MSALVVLPLAGLPDIYHRGIVATVNMGQETVYCYEFSGFDIKDRRQSFEF